MSLFSKVKNKIETKINKIKINKRLNHVRSQLSSIDMLKDHIDNLVLDEIIKLPKVEISTLEEVELKLDILKINKVLTDAQKSYENEIILKKRIAYFNERYEGFKVFAKIIIHEIEKDFDKSFEYYFNSLKQMCSYSEINFDNYDELEPFLNDKLIGYMFSIPYDTKGFDFDFSCTKFCKAYKIKMYPEYIKPLSNDTNLLHDLSIAKMAGGAIGSLHAVSSVLSDLKRAGIMGKIHGATMGTSVRYSGSLSDKDRKDFFLAHLLTKLGIISKIELKKSIFSIIYNSENRININGLGELPKDSFGDHIFSSNEDKLGTAIGHFIIQKNLVDRDVVNELVNSKTACLLAKKIKHAGI